MKLIVLKVETTGLYDDAELLNLVIIDEMRNVLWNKYYKPTQQTEWPDAESVNRISPEDVKNCGSVQEDLEDIQKIIDSSDIVASYNVPFHMGMLRSYGLEVDHKRLYDVMDEAALWYGEYNEFFGSYQYIPLWKCTERFGYEFYSEECGLQKVNEILTVFHAINRRRFKDSKGTDPAILWNIKESKYNARRRSESEYTMWKVTQEEMDSLISEHELWLKTNGEQGEKLDLLFCDLSEIRFIGKNISGATFSFCWLWKSVFEECQLNDVVLWYCSIPLLTIRKCQNCNLDIHASYGASCTIEDISLNNLIMSKAILPDMYLSKATVEKSIIDDSYLRYLTGRDVQLCSALVDSCDLYKSKIADFKINDSEFRYSDLREMTCFRLHINNTKDRRSEYTATQFFNSSINKCIYEETMFCGGIRFYWFLIANTTFNNCILEDDCFYFGKIVHTDVRERPAEYITYKGVSQDQWFDGEHMREEGDSFVS